MGIQNKNGALYFASGIDNSGLKRDSEEAKRYLQDITDFAKKTGAVLGVAFSVGALKQFGQEVINVRGEMQMLESSFDVLLGGKGVSGFLNELKQFAVDSPLSLTGVSNAAQTLLGFGIEAERVMPIVKQLGDVSMGNEQRFQSLSLAFAQMSSAGKLMGQDLLQFINAGFNPLQIISEKTGKSIGDLRKEMESGSISSEMVADAFRAATAEGGKFYGMTQKQAEGIKGLQAQLEGGLQEAFNKMGKSQEGLIAGGYKTAISLVEDYEKVGRVITSLIATYGAYKAALVVVTTAESGWTLAQMTKYKWLVMVERAQRLLNATMLKNPYVAVTTLVVGLITTLIALKDRTTAAEKAQKRLNDLLDEAKDRKEALKTKGSELIAVLTSETATVYQQIKAYKELLTLLPQLKGKTLDEIKAMKPEDIQTMIAERSDQVEIETVQKQYEERIKNIEGYRKKIKELQKSGADSATISYYREQLGQAIADSKVLKTQLDEIAHIQKEAFYQENPEAKRKDLQLQRTNLLQKEKELTEKIGKAQNDLESANDRLQLNAVKSAIKGVDEQLNSLNKTTETATVKNHAYWEKIKEDAEKARKALGTDQEGSKEWDELTKKINQANAELRRYSDKAAETDANKALKDAQMVADSTLELKRASVERELAVRQAELDISQARIDMMDEGFAKEQAQIELNHNKELLAIQKRTKELIEKQQEIERKEWEKAGSKGVFKPTTYSVNQLPSDQQGELNNWYDVAWATYRNNQAKNQKALLDQYRTFEQQRADINKKFDADAKAIKDQNLADEKERLTVLEKQRKDAIKSINAAETAETEKSSQLFVKLFSDSSRMSTARIKEVTAEAKKLVDYLSGVSKTLPSGFSESQLEAMKTDPEKIKAIYDALIQKQDELDNRTNYPFSNIIKGFENWKKAAENTAKANKEANEETKRYLLNEADALRAKGLEYIKDGAVEAADGLSTLSGLMRELAEASGDSRFSEFASQMGAVSENIASAAKGFQQGGWIGAIIGGAQNMIEQTIQSFAQAKAEQKEFEQNRLDFLDAYNLKLLEVDDKDFDTIFGSSGLEKARDAAEKAQEALAKYYELIRKTTSPETQKEFRSLGAAIFGGLHFGSWIGLTKSLSSESKALMDAYKKGYSDIQAMAIKTKDYSGWANFWGKKDKYTSLKDLAPELWDKDGDFNVDAAQKFLDTNTQISDEQRKQIQNIIDLKNAYEANMEIIRDDLQDTFGNLGSGLMDSIENAIRTGANMWDLFREAGENSLESLGRKIAYELHFSKKFAKLQEDLEKTYELGDSQSIANKQMELMDKFFNSVGTDMENAQKWLERWQAEAEKRGFDLYQDKNSSTSGVTGELKAQMTEQKGSQLVGLWNMTAMDIRQIREYFEKNPTRDVAKEINNLLNELQAIRENTGKTADNTEYLEDGIKKLESLLDEIKKNTKPNNSRI